MSASSPPGEQLGDAAGDAQALVLAEQERCRSELDPVLADHLQPGVGRAGPGEQRDVTRLGPPPQAHHPRYVRTVKVGVDQAGAVPLRGQGQGQVHRDGGLPDPALPARDRDDRYLVRAVRHDPLPALAIRVAKLKIS